MPNHRARTAVLAALIPFACSACGLLGPDDGDSPLLNQIDHARAIWNASGSPSYTVVAIRACDCPIDSPPVTIEVVDDEIVGIVYADTEEPVEETNWGRYATLDDLFDIARDAAKRRVPVLTVQYDPDYSFISQIVVNYDLTRTDDDFIYLVESYEPATTIQ